MDIEILRDYCLSLEQVEESSPFGPDTLVYKVGGKMFALLGIKENPILNVKCNPEEALQLREDYESVIPGYHMNKKHWNTIQLTVPLEEGLIRQWVLDSYALVKPKASRNRGKKG